MPCQSISGAVMTIFFQTMLDCIAAVVVLLPAYLHQKALSDRALQNGLHYMFIIQVENLNAYAKICHNTTQIIIICTMHKW